MIGVVHDQERCVFDGLSLAVILRVTNNVGKVIQFAELGSGVFYHLKSRSPALHDCFHRIAFFGHKQRNQVDVKPTAAVRVLFLYQRELYFY